MNSEQFSERPGLILLASSFSRNRVSPPWHTQLLQCAGFFLLAVVSYFFICHYILQTVEVVGMSMAPTLNDSDRHLLNRWVYYLHPPQRKDIVVIKDPTDGAFVVKRIIAQPGDAILFKGGQVYVNGDQLAEPYVARGGRTYTGSLGEHQLIVCGKDQYFVLGDNRENSFDSRMYGPVRRQNILGAVNL